MKKDSKKRSVEPEAREGAEDTRGEATRRRLLAAAVDLFGRHGFDSVTTRQLAEAAGVNQAAIPYHFGGKLGLFEAVTRYLGELFGQVGGDRVRRIIETAANTDKAGLATMVDEFVGGVLTMVLGVGLSEAAGRFVIREYSNPGRVFEILYTKHVEIMHKALAALAAAALGLAPESPEAKLRAHTLMGQMMAFVAGRPVLLRRMGWDAYTPENVALVVEAVTQSVKDSLGLPGNKEVGK